MRWKVGGYLIPVEMKIVGSRIELEYPFNKAVTAEIKMMEGAKWHGFDEHKPRKIWSIANSIRNRFQIDYLSGGNPYADYDKPIIDVPTRRSLYKHQKELYQHGYTRRYGIWASEMGTGKSLAAIELCERLIAEHKILDENIWFIGPQSAVRALRLELKKWQATFNPLLFTYEALTQTVKNWREGQPAPQIVIFDEASKIKTPTAQRTQAAMHLAGAVRDEHKGNGCVILMSGSPAPKSPVDWWSLCETACPGFIKEGNALKFKASLCLIEQREGLGGAMYPHLVTWFDDENKCKICGDYKDAVNHMIVDDRSAHEIAATVRGFSFNGEKPKTSTDVKATCTKTHAFEPSKNEVARLYKRMQGLVIVKFKKDCLDLPEKQYQVLQAKPTIDMIRASKAIKSIYSRAVEVLTMMRELSDGFMYKERVCGQRICHRCMGNKKVIGAEDTPADEVLGVILNQDTGQKMIEVKCPVCKGTGQEDVMERYAEEIGSPKDELLVDLLDQNEEDGRIVLWGGFEGTINRLVKIVHAQGWATLKIDGKGWIGEEADGTRLSTDDLLVAMDISHPRYKEFLIKYPKLAVIGNPKAGGMALTFTGAKMAVYFSNSFDGEARWQSEDRIHRPGADHNRGVTIVDLVCLSTDMLVLENLQKKKNLQDLTLGELPND